MSPVPPRVSNGNADFTDPALTGAGLLYVGVDIPITGYDSWAALPANGLTAGVNDGPSQDPDNDGIRNMLEFVLGGLAMTSSSDTLPKLVVNATNFAFTFNRNDDSEAEVPLAFQWGTTLASWRSTPSVHRRM